VSVLDSVLGLIDGDEYKDKIGKYYGKSDAENMNVAGHKISSLWMYFAYNTDNEGIILNDDENVRLYRADYGVEVRDLNKDYDDLLKKLISLYGEPLQEGSVQSDIYDSHVCAVWLGAESTLICLTKGMYVTGDPRLEISYASLKGNEWLLEVYESILAAEAEKIQNSVEGL